MKLLFTLLPAHNGHMLFCDGNFCKLIKYRLLCSCSYSRAVVKQRDAGRRGWQSNRTWVCRSSRTERAGCWGSMLLRITLRYRDKHTSRRHVQMELRLSGSNNLCREKPKLSPAIHGCTSAPSKYRKSLIYSAAVRRAERLNTRVLKFYSAEGLFSFHSPLTSSVQLDCFAFSIQPCSSGRPHILKCREMWKWNLPDAAFCDITNFYQPHTSTYTFKL